MVTRLRRYGSSIGPSFCTRRQADPMAVYFARRLSEARSLVRSRSRPIPRLRILRPAGFLSHRVRKPNAVIYPGVSLFETEILGLLPCAKAIAGLNIPG